MNSHWVLSCLLILVPSRVSSKTLVIVHLVVVRSVAASNLLQGDAHAGHTLVMVVVLLMDDMCLLLCACGIFNYQNHREFFLVS